MELPKSVPIQEVNNQHISEKIRNYIAIKFLYFIFGLIFSRNVIFENYSPFGAALISSVPYENMWPALIGTILGYLLPNRTIFSIRYIATVLAIQAIRWTFNDLKKVKDHILFSPLLAAVVTIATGFSLNIHYFSLPKSLSIILIEALLSATFSYLFKESSYLIAKTQYKLNLQYQKLVSSIVFILMILISFANLKFGDISIGRILGLFFILLSANCFGLLGGSIAGIGNGIIFGFSNPSLNFLAGSYAFSGMLAGLLSRYGKFITAFVFITSNLIIVLQNNDPLNIIINVYELFFASILFFFIPENLTRKISYFFDLDSPQKLNKEIKIDFSIINRLKSTADSLKKVTNSINKVSEKLMHSQKNSDSKLIETIKGKICSHCGLKTLCWENKKNNTILFFQKFHDILKKRDKNAINNFKNEYSGKCQRFFEIENYIKKYIKDNKAKVSLKSKNDEIKNIISEQFSEMSDILIDISKDFSEDYFLDTELTEKIAEILKENNVLNFDVICKTNKPGRLKIEINIPNIKKERLIDLNLHKLISRESFKVFEEPFIEKNNDGYKVKILEKPKFKLQIGTCQHICNNGTWCGDNFNYFDDENGNMIFILSDGMGTGGMAAIEGALACEVLSDLLKTGMNIETALKITNSALLLKSDDESLAAIDVVFINLYTGQARFIKAGAAASFIKTSEKTQKVELSSLPIGIFKNISFFSQNETLNVGDWILILSDGAIFPDELWIEESLKNNKLLDSQNLAEDIVNKAIKNRENNYDDDITVIAVKIE